MICDDLYVPFFVSKRMMAASMFLLYISGFLTYLWTSLYTAIMSREGDKPVLPFLFATKIWIQHPFPCSPSQPHTLEEELDQIIDLMHRHDTVSIRQQFESYSKPIDELKNLVYGAVLFPIGNSQKLQLKLSGPL